MLQNLWTVIDSAPFVIRIKLAKTYIIPVCEIFVNCDNHDNRKFNLACNNIARYVFLKGRLDHISHSAYQIFGLKFDNLLKITCLIPFHKIIKTEQPEYLLGRIKSARSFRGRKIVQQLLSQ